MSVVNTVNKGAFRVYEYGHEVLVLKENGKIITRSLTRDGKLEVQMLRRPDLIRWIRGFHERLAVEIEPIPEPFAAEYRIPSVFTLYTWDHGCPVMSS